VTHLSSHAYAPCRWLVSVVGQDLVLLGVLIWLALARPAGPFPKALAFGIVVTLVWQIVTLHDPSRVEVSDGGVAFFAYGRVHRFAWDEVREWRVRRFLVRARVLVRVVPSSPFRGRYWLLDSIDDFDGLLRSLQAPRSTRVD
jgi:hypothetical protein